MLLKNMHQCCSYISKPTIMFTWDQVQIISFDVRREVNELGSCHARAHHLRWHLPMVEFHLIYHFFLIHHLFSIQM